MVYAKLMAAKLIEIELVGYLYLNDGSYLPLLDISIGPNLFHGEFLYWEVDPNLSESKRTKFWLVVGVWLVVVNWIFHLLTMEKESLLGHWPTLYPYSVDLL